MKYQVGRYSKSAFNEAEGGWDWEWKACPEVPKADTYADAAAIAREHRVLDRDIEACDISEGEQKAWYILPMGKIYQGFRCVSAEEIASLASRNYKSALLRTMGFMDAAGHFAFADDDDDGYEALCRLVNFGYGSRAECALVYIALCFLHSEDSGRFGEDFNLIEMIERLDPSEQFKVGVVLRFRAAGMGASSFFASIGQAAHDCD